jgi:hypothetical protein
LSVSLGDIKVTVLIKDILLMIIDILPLSIVIFIFLGPLDGSSLLQLLLRLLNCDFFLS